MSSTLERQDSLKSILEKFGAAVAIWLTSDI